MDLIASSPDKAIKNLLDFTTPTKPTTSGLPTREILDSPYKWTPSEPIPEALQPIVLIPPVKHPHNIKNSKYIHLVLV